MAQAPIFGGWCPPFLTAQKYRPGTAGSGGCQRLEIQASKDEKARGAWAGLGEVAAVWRLWPMELMLKGWTIRKKGHLGSRDTIY